MVVDIEENLPHEVAEVICLKCLHRGYAVYPEETPLKDLECKCGAVGYVIKTGQTIPDTPDEQMENDKRYQNMARMYGKKEARQKYEDYILS